MHLCGLIKHLCKNVPLMSIFGGGLSHKYIFFIDVRSQFHFVMLEMLFKGNLLCCFTDEFSVLDYSEHWTVYHSSGP